MIISRKLCVLWCQGGQICRSFIRRNVRFFVFTFNIYVITFLIVLPIMCNDWAFSNYYFRGWKRSDMEARAAALNDYHAAEASEYIANLKTNLSLSLPKHLPSEEVDIAIGVVTVPRSNPQHRLDYLTQTFVALHRSLSQDSFHFKKRALFMCNTYPGPGNHTELQNISSLVLVHNKYPKDNASAATMSRFEKEKQDYVYCLDIALTYKPKYVLIIEDDTLAFVNFLDVLHYILFNMVENKISSGHHSHNSEKWAYLKLFYPNRWKGYANELAPMLELISIGLIGGSLFALLGVKCNKRESGLFSTFVYFTIGSLYFALCAVMIGRQYLIEWRRISKYTYTVVPAPDCCSPAILYAADKAKQLSTYLRTVKCTASYPIDFAMDEFAKLNSYKKYLVEPNILQHIGMFSSLKSKSRFPHEFIYRH